MLQKFPRLGAFFRKKLTKKRSNYQILQHITLNNLTPIGKRKYLKGHIYLVYCKGRYCIMLVLYFDGFRDNHRRFFSKK